MICFFECTFCKPCVNRVPGNVCPNCGGGFVPSPVRPAQNRRGDNDLGRYPVSDTIKHRPVDPEAQISLWNRSGASLRTSDKTLLAGMQRNAENKKKTISHGRLQTTHMAKVVPTTSLHFLCPWRSDVGRSDYTDVIGRVESGTETENNAGAVIEM
jgi:hypothetical protein